MNIEAYIFLGSFIFKFSLMLLFNGKLPQSNQNRSSFARTQRQYSGIRNSRYWHLNNPKGYHITNYKNIIKQTLFLTN